MHPFLSQHLARLHREELQREAANANATSLAHGNADSHKIRRTFYHLVFGLPVPSSPISSVGAGVVWGMEWTLVVARTTFRIIGLGAFGIGSLLGGFLGTRFGLLPPTLLGCIICLAITLPIL